MRRGRAGFASVVVAVALVAVACGSGPILPDLTGQPLDRAKTAASDAGFDDVISHDVRETRSQWQDSNWQVCDQTPTPGPADTDDRVDLGVVRVEEPCPGAAPPPPATTTPSSTTTPPPTTTTAALTPDVDADVDRPYVPRPGSGSGSSGSSDDSGDDGSSSGGSAYYSSCAQAKAAGAAPMRVGEPGYRPGLDGNSDGVACEN